MKYIYDIVLNFQNEYIDFYEWNPVDKYEEIASIKLYQLSNKDYLNFKYNECIIENRLGSKILITNGIEVIGILINKNGKILKRSSLLFEEANDILKKASRQKREIIKYKSLKYKKITYEGRVVKEKKQYIDTFLKNKKIDKYLLKYIYFELTNKEEDNINIIEKKLKEYRDTNLNKLYNVVSNIKKYN